MPYELNGTILASDDEGYLLEPNYSDEIVPIIAAAENIVLTPEHWQVIEYLRNIYKDEGKTPNFRNLLKDIQAFMPEASSQSLYDLFPVGPAKQAVKIAGLPQPYGKGGY